MHFCRALVSDFKTRREGGGKLKDIADITIRVPARETFKIQEYHLPVYHALCIAAEEEFFGGGD